MASKELFVEHDLVFDRVGAVSSIEEEDIEDDGENQDGKKNNDGYRKLHE